MSDTALLLDRVEAFVRRYVVLDDVQATAVALWVLHAWAIEAAHATPYLFVTSAEAECGKTRLLEVLRELVRMPLFTMDISDAALFRAIEQERPTLFFDEVDAVFNPRTAKTGAKDELRALLNAGYRRGQLVYRMGGGNNTTLQSFNVFGAKALAGLGSLPGTLASRCVRIELKRRRLDEPVEDFYPEDVGDESAALSIELESWAGHVLPSLSAARPARVQGLRDRTNEVWRPLLAIAALAEPAWTGRARRAAVALAGKDANDEPSFGVLLLGDIRAVFAERDAERIATADLVRYLGAFDESPWSEWWIDAKTNEPNQHGPRRLAQLLRPYGIRATAVRVGDKTPRGYKREDFADAWERFLPVTSSERAEARDFVTDPARVLVQQVQHPQQPAPHGQTDVAHVADVALGRGEADAEKSVTKSGQLGTVATRTASDHSDEDVGAPLSDTELRAWYRAKCQKRSRAVWRGQMTEAESASESNVWHAILSLQLGANERRRGAEPDAWTAAPAERSEP